MDRASSAGKAMADAMSSMIQTWYLTGPFDNTGWKGHDKVFGPEKSPFSRAAVFTDKRVSLYLGNVLMRPTAVTLVKMR